jgi:arsenate reductase
MSTDNLTIYYSPKCSKSRETLQILEQNKKRPQIIEYLQTPPNKQALAHIIKMLGISPRDILRTSEQAYADTLLDDTATDEQIIEAICKHPILLQRPIVISGNRAVIGRPPSRVLEII